MASADDIQREIDRTRADLAATLNELEDKLNIPKQLGIKAREAKAAFDRNPTPWLAGAGTAALIVVGIAVFALRRR